MRQITKRGYCVGEAHCYADTPKKKWYSAETGAALCEVPQESRDREQDAAQRDGHKPIRENAQHAGGGHQVLQVGRQQAEASYRQYVDREQGAFQGKVMGLIDAIYKAVP